MKLDGIAEGMNISGQVVPSSVDSTKVKIINGKRMIWIVSRETGSNMTGRWVEEGSKEAGDLTTFGVDALNRIQEHRDLRQEGRPGGR